MARRYWASRLQRGNHEWFWNELNAGRLRQGWGYDERQDLREVMAKPRDKREPVEREVERQRHMAGGKDGWREGDIVLVPNMPRQGKFSLVEVTGPYRFEKPDDHEDFRHIREVRLLTANGVANTHKLVDSKLRKTLRNVGRTWEIRGRDEAVEQLVAKSDDPSLADHSMALERAQDVVSAEVATLKESVKTKLNHVLGKAEWEPVIAKALEPYFPADCVKVTGGRSEQGADITITIPNPFGELPWIIVVQVKDYDDEIGASVIRQLRKAIDSRRNTNDEGDDEAQVIAAIVAATNAEPSAKLNEAMATLQAETGVPVSAIFGDKLMQLVLAGLVQDRALHG